MQIDFNIMGEQIISTAIDVAARSLDNMQPFYKAAIDVIHDHSDELFASSGSRAESVPKWGPLAESTKKARARRWGYYKASPSRPGTLRWTGRMQESVRKTITRTYGEIEYDAKDKNGKTLALHHWKGGGKSRLPSRKVLELSPSVTREIDRALQTEIYRQLGTAGLRA